MKPLNTTLCLANWGFGTILKVCNIKKHRQNKILIFQNAKVNIKMFILAT